MPAELMERIKIDTFTDGIQDPETRKAVILAPKATLAETITCALTNETVQDMVIAAVKVRRVEISDSTGVERLNKPRDGRIRCWTCEKMGHISRDCWELKRKRMRSPSPMRRRPNEEKDSAPEENQTNTSHLNLD